jgi:hypothetical protein
MGFTTEEIIKGIHDCAFRLKSGLVYYFPTRTDVTEISKAKVDSLIEANDGIKCLITQTNTANQKKIRNCTMYFRGLKSIIQARSVSADKLVFDEIDIAEQEHVDHAMKRLDHSDFAEVTALSTPTIPDFGIDAMFQLTDQKYFWHWCDHCGKLTTCFEEHFPDCLRMTPDGVKRICIKCEKEIPVAHINNEWVAKYPGKEYRGRPTSGRCIGQINLDKPHILQTIYEEYYSTRYIQDFWNSRMAKAYIDTKDRLETQHILSMCSSNGMEGSSKGIPTIMGIDVGPVKHHVVISRKEYGGTLKGLMIGETDWNGLDDLMKRFNAYALIDGLPEPAKATAWAKKFPNRAWVCYYSKSPKAGLHWDDTLQKVAVYQTQAMDASHDILQTGKFILPNVSDKTKEFAAHCHNVARKKIEDEEDGSIRYKWIKLGPDHYRKAFSYMCLLIERTPETKYSGHDYSFLFGNIGNEGKFEIADSYS